MIRLNKLSEMVDQLSASLEEQDSHPQPQEEVENEDEYDMEISAEVVVEELSFFKDNLAIQDGKLEEF